MIHRAATNANIKVGEDATCITPSQILQVLFPEETAQLKQKLGTDNYSIFVALQKIFRAEILAAKKADSNTFLAFQNFKEIYHQLVGEPLGQLLSPELTTFTATACNTLSDFGNTLVAGEAVPGTDASLAQALGGAGGGRELAAAAVAQGQLLGSSATPPDPTEGVGKTDRAEEDESARGRENPRM